MIITSFIRGQGVKGLVKPIPVIMVELETQFDRLNQAMTEVLLITTNGEHHEDTDC